MAQPSKQLPLRHAETAAAFVLVVQAVAGLVGLVLGWSSGSLAALAAGWHLLAGGVVWLACLVHQRLRRMAREEALETESLREAEEESSALFEEEMDLLSAQRRLEQFEKYFLPAFSVAIAVVLGLLSFFLLRRVSTLAAAEVVRRPLMTAVVFIGIAFVSFLLAKYTAGLAVEAPWGAVRPGANYTMSCALASALVGLALVLCHFKVPVGERVMAYAVPVLMGLLAAETLLFLVWGIYRPRVPGQEARPAHDSRLLGMLTTSGGILRTTAETLDYQFGFKVSETWFYRFMERAIAPLILFQLFTLYLLTCFVVVDSGEQAVIELLGKPRQEGKPLGPGLHVKWPWPIEVAYRHPVDRVELLSIGEQLKADVPGYTWTKSHAEAPFSVVVATREASPEGETEAGEEARPVPAVSMLAGTVNVYYSVANLYDYLYNHHQPKRTLEALCYHELTRYAAEADFLEFLTEDRAEAMVALKSAIQGAADDLGLGVAVHNVTLTGLHPPVEVGRAFEAVIAAIQKRETRVWKARGYVDQTLPAAEAQATQSLEEAKTYRVRRTEVTPAITYRYQKMFEAYRRAPDVFLHRKRMSALEAALAGRPKIIKPDWIHTVDEELNIDLKPLLVPGFGIGEAELMATEE
ncbi:MAG: protease modulator HflK [bacterium]